MKRHLQPLDAFYGILMRPKCISGRGSARNPAEGVYSGPPDSFLAGGEGLAAPPQEPLPDLGLRPRIAVLRASGVHPQDKFLTTSLGSG